jgi:Mrp family chromosome partitioning ATPase
LANPPPKKAGSFRRARKTGTQRASLPESGDHGQPPAEGGQFDSFVMSGDFAPNTIMAGGRSGGNPAVDPFEQLADELESNGTAKPRPSAQQQYAQQQQQAQQQYAQQQQQAQQQYAQQQQAQQQRSMMPPPQQQAQAQAPPHSQPPGRQRQPGALPPAEPRVGSQSRPVAVPGFGIGQPTGGGLAASFTQAVVVQQHEQVEIDKRETHSELNDPRLLVALDPDSPQAAAYRVLGHRLVSAEGIRTVLVSSADDGDGKTTCAVNLALALSECGRASVLLVEANLRRPSIAAMLGMVPPICFSEQIVSHRDNLAAPWTVAECPTPWLHVMAINPQNFKKPEVIDGPALEMGIERLKCVDYDYIIVDTPSVLSCADVNMMQDCADGVLLVARARESKGRPLKRAVERLFPGRILGLAMIDG